MRIWVTRSEPGASVLAEALETEGHSVVTEPVLTVVKRPFVVPQKRYEIGVVLSVHGVRFGGSALQRVDAVFAIGAQTQAALEQLGVASRIPPQATSESLIEALGDVAGRTVLIVSGRGGRGVLQSELTSRGATVERLDVYERTATAPIALAAQTIDAIIVSSGDGFEYAVQVWFAAGGRADVPVLVPSGRVAGLAHKLGVNNVHDCLGAGSEAVLNVLRQLAEE